jgi:hypothetical protein
MRKFLILIVLIFNLLFTSCDGETVFLTVDRAKEALVEDNMIAVQEVVEAMSRDLLGAYPTTEVDIERKLPPNFRNPFDETEHPVETFIITAGAPTFRQGDIVAHSEGRVEYAHDANEGSDDASSYTISGAGKDDRVLEFYITSKNKH